jgi:hypothetical protein
MTKTPKFTKSPPATAKRWTLAQIYHHVLARSPSPEAAKIAIADARLNGKLHFYCEKREHKARPDLVLNRRPAPPPKNAKIESGTVMVGEEIPQADRRRVQGKEPPQLKPDIVSDVLLPKVNFSSWDWERDHAIWHDPETKSHFEYVGIYADADEVLRLWPKAADDVKPRTARPGPPAIHDWFAICGEIARRCIDPQTRRVAIPNSENKLAEAVLGWCHDETDRRPAESEMRKAVKEICAALRKV